MTNFDIYPITGKKRVLGLPKTTAAVLAAKAGRARSKIAIIGPSTARGLGSGSGGSFDVGMAQNDPATLLAQRLTELNIPAEQNCIFGIGNTATYNAWDARLTVGSGWVAGAYARATIGGSTWSNSLANTNALVFTPAINYDKVDVYYADNGARPDMIVAINGVDVETISTVAGTTAIRKKSYTTTLGKNAISIRKATATASEIAIIGIDCYDSTAPKISVMNFGWCSSTAIDLADVGHVLFPLTLPSWQFDAAHKLLAPDLTIMAGFGTNEWFLNNTDVAKQAANTPTAFRTALDSICTTVKVSGDLILETFHPDGRAPTIGGGFLQDDFQAAIKASADANGATLFDVANKTGFYNQGNNMGLYADLVHYKAYGYAFEAYELGNIISRT